ncbi:MAG: Transcriptional regulator, MarR family [Actinomycetia bacterium]|nr:Transcriptional regulator, MarR family [Actinomycetes bacterium]
MGSDTKSLAQVELELAVLARTLEGLSRRSQIHRELDRASYLLARTLSGDGQTSIKGLAAALGLDATTVTRQVATMEAARLVTRTVDPSDGRVSLIELSPLGRRKMEAVRSARERRMDELLDDWPESDRREFGRLLQRLNEALFEDHRQQ